MESSNDISFPPSSKAFCCAVRRRKLQNVRAVSARRYGRVNLSSESWWSGRQSLYVWYGLPTTIRMFCKILCMSSKQQLS